MRLEHTLQPVQRGAALWRYRVPAAAARPSRSSAASASRRRPCTDSAAASVATSVIETCAHVAALEITGDQTSAGVRARFGRCQVSTAGGIDAAPPVGSGDGTLVVIVDRCRGLALV